MEAKPDTVVYSNGRIVDGRRHILNGHLITQGAAIIAVGSGEPKRAVSPGSVRHVDLAGRTLLPGFIDCHSHFTMNADAAPPPTVAPAIPCGTSHPPPSTRSTTIPAATR